MRIAGKRQDITGQGKEEGERGGVRGASPDPRYILLCWRYGGQEAAGLATLGDAPQGKEKVQNLVFGGKIVLGEDEGKEVLR